MTESGGAPVAGAQVFLDADGDDAFDLGELPDDDERRGRLQHRLPRARDLHRPGHAAVGELVLRQRLRAERDA